jgi:MoaA/NifB/PqqE/SkfB family radical SAM enzyme
MSAEAPETVIWIVTHRCNLSCRHCYAVIYSNEREVGEEHALRAAKMFAEAGVKHLHITGGEPLLWAPLWRLLSASDKEGLKTSLFTNATLLPLKPELAAKIVTYTSKVYTSKDGPSPEVHDSIRGEGSFREGSEWYTPSSEGRRKSTCEYVGD